MLTETTARSADPGQKSYMLRDDQGLYLRVDPSGCKYWIVRYWEDKKEHRTSLGTYPEISLNDAREKRNQLRKVRASGEKISELPNAPEIFSDVVKEWLKVRMANKAANYLRTINFRLQKYILPELGAIKMVEIKTPDILLVCRKIEYSGRDETARRVRTIIGQVFRFAIASGWCDFDPMQALTGDLKPRRSKRFATMTDPAEIALLMQSIKAYPYALMRCAMLFSVYTVARPGETRLAEWSEIDFENQEWRIPASKMKMKRIHIVPLARQTIELLNFLKQLTGNGKWLFPSVCMDGKPMSDNTIRIALRSMGYSNEEMTAHGFRGMASTRLNELGWRADVIERQLAHCEKNSVRAAYNHAEYLDERRKMMQFWADYLEKLIVT